MPYEGQLYRSSARVLFSELAFHVTLTLFRERVSKFAHALSGLITGACKWTARIQVPAGFS